jgi:hypothetical protein
MGRKLEFIDYGNAITETKQTAPYGFYPDNMFGYSAFP